MMEINRHNYEAYLLDLMEGCLSVEDVQKLRDFLLLNPDCAGELTEIEPWVLEGQEHSFQSKGRLKKEFPNASAELNDHNFDLFSIARMEGDLNRLQEDAHQAKVSADDLKLQQWLEWQQTRLVPGEVSFKEKDKLKHKSGPKRSLIWIPVISTAAAIALLFVLFRTGPDLPLTEQALEASGEATDIQVQPEAQAEDGTVFAGDMEDQAVQPSPDPPVQRIRNPVMFSVMKEHERPVESGSKMTVISQEDLNTGLLAGSVERINALSPAVEVVPDKIEALHIPRVPVHLSSLTVGQIYDMDLQEVVESYAEESNFSLLTVANAGIRGINKLAKSDISLLASKNEEGDVSGIQLKGKRFSLSRPLGQKE